MFFYRPLVCRLKGLDNHHSKIDSALFCPVDSSQHHQIIKHMYTPAQFKITDEHQIRSFMDENSFAILISTSEANIETSFLPLYLSKDLQFLYGHLAKANSQWTGWQKNPKVRVLFHGPHAYISPSYYQSSFNVPTWNYTAVSVDGTIEIVEDLKEQKKIINDLVGKHESAFSKPWTLDENDERMMGLFKAIICFKIKIEAIVPKFKLNQNKNEEDQRNVIQHLKQSKHPGDDAVAALMEENLKNSKRN